MKNTFWLNKANMRSLKRTSIFNLKLIFHSGYCLFQIVSIPMGTHDPAPLWANLYYESKYITNLIRTKKLRGRRFPISNRFIGDLCALNNSSEFGKAFLEIYQIELELKVEHDGNHATFLDLDIPVDKGK